MTLARPLMHIEPWERQRGESARAYDAFEHYRDYGPERTLKVTAAAKKKAIRLIERWSSDHHWASRVLAYDQYTSKIKLAQRRRKIEKAQDKAYLAGERLVDRALDALAEVDVDDLSTDQIMKWLDTGAKLQRQALEAFAERVQHDPMQVNVAIDNRELHIDGAGRPRSALAEYLDRHPDRIPVITEMLERAQNNDPMLLPEPTTKESKDVTPRPAEPARDVGDPEALDRG